MNWTFLTSLSQLDEIVELSHQVPCLIFKHSTRCGISSIARHRLEADWDFADGELEPFFLDLLAFPKISAAVSERFSVWHESPQALLVWQGECLHDTSHLDISVEELKEVLRKPQQALRE